MTLFLLFFLGRGRALNKKYLKIILVSLCVFLLFTIACDLNSIKGSGTIIKTDRPVSGFNKVSISGSGHLFISQGNSESLEIMCDDNIAPYIRTIVKNGVLEISPKKNITLNPSQPIRYSLSLKNITSLKTSGSVIAKSSLLKTESLSVAMSGSGKFSLKKFEAQSISLDISGSGESNIESGRSKTQKISISGSGEFNAPNLKSENSDFTISGSGKAKVWVTNKLDIKISGSGKLYYYGSPRITTSISGSGKVESLGKK